MPMLALALVGPQVEKSSLLVEGKPLDVRNSGESSAFFLITRRSRPPARSASVQELPAWTTAGAYCAVV